MVCLQVPSIDIYKVGEKIVWSETSQWSGAKMMRTGIITGISRAQSGCYHIQIDNGTRLGTTVVVDVEKD
jgi:hypothetical protein